MAKAATSSELDVTTLVFAGCNYPNCPRTSIYDASQRDYRVVLVVDAVSGIERFHSHEASRIGVIPLHSEIVTTNLSRD